MTIDVQWFQNRIRDLGLSQRQVSAKIANNPNVMSLILTGKRRVPHSEIPLLAQLLDTAPEEILLRLGGEALVTPQAKDVEVIGMVDDTGKVTPQTHCRTVKSPVVGTHNMGAVIYETIGGSRNWMHGWVLYFEKHAKSRGVGADTLGAMCLVEVGEKEGNYVAAVQRSLERGRYDLVHPFTADRIVSGVAVRSATPILWVRTEA